MKARVTIIGPSDLTERILEYYNQNLQRFDNLLLTPCAYDHEREAASLVQHRLADTDVFLFTGPVPHQLVKESLPHLTTCTDSLSVLPISVLQVLIDNQFFPCSSERKLRLSVDFVSRASIETLFEDLGLDNYELYLPEEDGVPDAEQLISFHQQLLSENKTDFAVTYLTSAYDSLRNLGLPVFRSKITNSAIREALTRINLSANSLFSTDAQICHGIVRLRQDPSGSNSAYENRRSFLIVTDCFISFCERLNASFRIEKDDELTLTTTRSMMEMVTGKGQLMPLLAELETLSTAKVSVGIGYGLFANNAEKNARQALKEAETDDESSCCYLADDGHVIHMEINGDCLSFDSATCDAGHIALAKNCGVGVLTLNRVAGIAETKPNCIFTANDVAHGLKITLRSARRILRDLALGGAVQAVGEQQGLERGRPRKLYAITER